MWLFFALIAPFFWAIVHVLDEHCVDHILERPWMGVITSAVASGLAYVALPFLAPSIDWSSAQVSLIALSFLVGCLIQLSQGFYFTALSFSEAGIVAAYWNMIPALLPIASFLLFGTVLTTSQYLGIVVLIFASTTMCLLDYHLETRIHTLSHMFFASALQVVAYLLMSRLYQSMDFFITFYSIITGIVVSGLAPLLIKKIRRRFSSSMIKIKPALLFFAVIEIANVLALGSAQMAIKLGDASLVAAAETTAPAFTLLLSIVWLSRMKNSQVALWNNFEAKMLVGGTMVYGVWLIS